MKKTILSPASELAGMLRRMISQGTLPLGARLSTERELATRHEVSRTTVRQALEILQSEHCIARQQGRGTFVTDPHHAPIESVDANWIGALVYQREYYFEPVVQAVSAQASHRGYATATGMNDTGEVEALHVSSFIKNRVRGVVLAPHGSASLANYQRLLSAGLSVVLMDGLIAAHQEDYVAVDNYQGTVLATKHLLELGHRRIAYLGYDAPDDIPCSPERRRGFLEALQQAGVAVEPKWILELPYKTIVSRVNACLRQKGRPTAFVAYNDPLACVVLEEAQEAGLSVPRDLSIVGFDNSVMGQRAQIPLTTIDPEQREMGLLAVNLLIDKIENPRQRPSLGTLIAPKLVIRESTAVAPGEASGGPK